MNDDFFTLRERARAARASEQLDNLEVRQAREADLLDDAERVLEDVLGVRLELDPDVPHKFLWGGELPTSELRIVFTYDGLPFSVRRTKTNDQERVVLELDVAPGTAVHNWRSVPTLASLGAALEQFPHLNREPKLEAQG